MSQNPLARWRSDWDALSKEEKRVRIARSAVAARTIITIAIAAILFPICPPASVLLFSIALRFLGS